MKTRGLIILTICVFCIPTAIRTIEFQETRQLKDAHDNTAWQAKIEKSRPDINNEKIQESIAIMQDGSLLQIFKKQALGSIILQTIVTVKWWFMDAFGAMLIGMILFRKGILTLQVPKAIHWRLLFVGYGVGLPISLWETMALINSDFDPLQQAITAFTYDIGRISMALGHLSLIFLLCQVKGQIKGWGLIKRSLASVGKMALSNYLGQSILCGIIFYGYGFGLYGQLVGYHLYFVVLIIWAIEIFWSVLWLRHYRFGPFEWLWRSLTYGKRQPMKI